MVRHDNRCENRDNSNVWTVKNKGTKPFVFRLVDVLMALVGQRVIRLVLLMVLDLYETEGDL